MKALKLAFLLLSVVLMCSMSFAKSTESDFLILPGRCIGKICLDDTKKIVRTRLGIPSSSMKLANAYEVEIWRTSKLKKPEHLFVVYHKGNVVDIHVTSDRFKTKDGISTFSKLGEAQVAYSHGEEVEYSIFQPSRNRVDWVVREEGITFTAAEDTEGPIIRIAVHRAGKEKTIGYSNGDEWYWYPEK